MRRRLLALATLLPVLAGAQVPSAKVLERYRQMLAANPAEGTALDRLWQAYSEQGRSGELIAKYQAQNTYAGQMILGLFLHKAGRDPEALTALQKALAFDPRNPAPALALGRFELAAAHATQAVTWFETAAKLLPDTDTRKTEVLMQLGAAALAAGDLNKATEAWEQTATLSPNDLALRHQLAETYVRNQLGPRAIPHLRFIEQHGPPQERALAWQQIGAIHQAQGEQDLAIQAIEKALSLTSPGNWLRTELGSQLIRLYQRYHRTAELEAKWKKFAEANPRDLGGYLQLINLYERLGEQPEQLVWLEKLVALTPRNGEYRLRLARLLARMDLLDRAATAYDQLLGTGSRNIDLVFERARIDVQRDQPQAAGERITTLLATAGTDEGIRTKALEFYQTNHLYELAEKHLREDAASGAEEPLLALAGFYFARHRDAEARQTLARLARRDDPPEKRAAAQFRIAGEFKTQNDMAAATQAVRTAIELKSDVRAYHFMLGELEAAAGRYAGAQDAFEHAYTLSQTPAERIEADQRLYDSLRNQKQPGEDEPLVTLPRPDSAAMATSVAAQTFLLNLRRSAVEEPSEEAWLRVARWQQWSRNQRGAIDGAQRALELKPDSIAAHDFLARLLAIDPQGPGAQFHLRELARIDAPNRTAYLRRLGQVQLQSGETEEALRTFQQITQESPGDIDALNDLAMAQQRADQWDQALATLKQVHTLSPAARKREAVTALLRIYDRLALRPQAAELLLQQIDAESETKDRFSLFGDLLTLCTRHGLLDWLRTQFEQRHKLRVDDYFTEVALGRVLKTQGNKTGAFEVLADAALAAPDPAEALPELVHEAEELHRLEAAVQLQEKLVRVVPQNGPEGFLRLAELQERSLQPDAAAETWRRLTARFPRDVAVLERAADFERMWGEPQRALQLLRRIRTIDPANRSALVQLAELSLSDGDPAEAEACLNQLLAEMPPEKKTDVVRYLAVRPDDPARVEVAYRTTVRQRSGRPSFAALKALRSFWFKSPESDKTVAKVNSRLETIQDLAELIEAKGDPAALEAWVARWTQPEVGPSERLWALYFSGASKPLLDEVEKMITARKDDAGPVNAFIWLALQTGEFERLGAWNADRQRTSSERDFLMIAFEQYLDEHPGPVPEDLAEKLFPEGQRINLWQAASQLAQHGNLRAAVKVGTRVLNHLPLQRADVAVELAQWQLQLGDLDGARKTLRSSIGGVYDSLNTSLYTAIRALYLLLPTTERPAFIQEVEAQIDEARRPVQATLTRVLLAGLAHDERKAQQQLDRLLELRAMSTGINDERATAATRQWDFVLGTGSQLVVWQLEGLARHLWTRALHDEAVIALQIQQPGPQGDAVRARVVEIRTRLAALQLMRADPAETDSILDEYARHAPPEGLVPLAEVLESFGANPLSVSIYRRLWSAEPSNPHALRNVLAACRNAGDTVSLEEILTRAVVEGHFRASEVAHRDLVQQLVAALSARGEVQRARQVLAEMIEHAPHEARPLLNLADLHRRAGDPTAAAATFRRLLSAEPANVAGRLAFATLLENQNKPNEAIDVLERASGRDLDARLATLYLRVGRFEETLAALERAPEADRGRISLALANELVTRGEAKKAMQLIRAALGRGRDPKMSFSLQSRLVELLPANAERSRITREVHHLRQLGEVEGSNLPNYFRLMQREAPRLGLEKELREELVQAWDHGQGETVIGAALVAMQIARGDLAAARSTWKELSAHPGLDHTALQTVLEALPENEPSRLRTEVLERFARRDAADPQRLINWSLALQAEGRPDQALAVAEEVAARAEFHPDLLAPAGDLFTKLKQPARARDFYRRGASLDPVGQKPALHLAYARLLLEARESDQARAELRTASRNPVADVSSTLVEYLVATERLGDFDAALSDFPLTSTGWQKLRAAIFSAHLDASRIEEAVRLAEKSPDVIDASSATRLHTAATRAGQFADSVRVLETAMVQGATAVRPELAGLLADWAEAELTALQVEPAIEHLARAHELQRNSWRITERLARLHLERNEPQQASRTLQSFLTVAADAAEREKATQLLKRIPGA